MTKDLNVFDKEYGLFINGEWTKGDLPPVDVPIKSGSPGLKVNRWDGDGLMGSELHRQRAGDAARRSEPVACVPGYCAA